MKITYQDIEITDVPGIYKITVRRDGGAGIPVVIIDADGQSQDWEIPPLAAYRDALTVAIEFAEGKTEAIIPRRESRVFTEGDPQPSDVEEVMDCDGDVWKLHKSTNTWLYGDATDGYSWSHLINTFGPLTEVVD